MSAHTEFAKHNDAYVANFGNKGSLPLPPAKKLTIVTCMDARIEPAGQLGVQEGDAHIIRNAGGVAKDALRSIVISQRLLGTREVAIIHHTDCGMLTFNTPHLREIVASSTPAAKEEVQNIDFLEFSDLEESVRNDVKFLKESELVFEETTVTGWIYEVETGKIRKLV